MQHGLFKILKMLKAMHDFNMYVHIWELLVFFSDGARNPACLDLDLDLFS